MVITNIEGFNPDFIQEQRKGWGFYKNPNNFVCCSKKLDDRFREIHDYKPNYDENTQYLKFIGRADLTVEVTPYILNVYKVYAYPTEDTTDN